MLHDSARRLVAATFQENASPSASARCEMSSPSKQQFCLVRILTINSNCTCDIPKNREARCNISPARFCERCGQAPTGKTGRNLPGVTHCKWLLDQSAEKSRDLRCHSGHLPIIGHPKGASGGTEHAAPPLPKTSPGM